ncbi:MAG: hypothetical protein JWR30_1871 [Conexibacter sp.]|nr:hypothetical protein [Conexibacter sp.]
MTFDPTAPATPSSAVLHSSGLTGIACPTTSQCTAIGIGTAYTFNPAAPQTPASAQPAFGMVAIACPSASQCTVLASPGNGQPDTLVTFDPGAPAQTTKNTVSGAGRLGRLSCPTTTQCTAVDAGGAVTTFNPTIAGSPTPVQISDLPLHVIDCPSTAQCTAAGSGLAVTFDPKVPGTPKAIDLGAGQAPPATIAGILHLACATAEQCTGVDNQGREVTFDPVPPLPPVATAKTLSLTSRKSVTVVAVVADGKPGTKVLARLTQGGKLRKRATLKIAEDTSFTRRLGHLRAGTYVAKFLVGGKVVTTTKIKVKRAR